MKKLITIMFMLALLITFTACGNASGDTPEPNQEDPSLLFSPVESEPSETAPPPDDAEAKILIVYFSRVGVTPYPDEVDAVTSASIVLQDQERLGNTEVIAKMIQQATGGEIRQLITAESYPVEYRKTTDVAKQEQNDQARPVLTSHVENLEDYDLIFLGYPNWWGTLPMAMFTFLEEYDFSGKTIIPFCTHDGSGLGKGPADIAVLCPDAAVKTGFAVRGSKVADAGADVEAWLREIGILD